MSKISVAVLVVWQSWTDHLIAMILCLLICCYPVSPACTDWNCCLHLLSLCIFIVSCISPLHHYLCVCVCYVARVLYINGICSCFITVFMHCYFLRGAVSICMIVISVETLSRALYWDVNTERLQAGCFQFCDCEVIYFYVDHLTVRNATNDKNCWLLAVSITVPKTN